MENVFIFGLDRKMRFLKNLFNFVFFLFPFSAFSAVWTPVLPDQQVSYSLYNVPVSTVVSLFYSQTLKTSFVLDSDVLQDNKLISFKFSSSPELSPRDFFVIFLDSLGYSILTKKGVDFISRKTNSPPENHCFFYRPNYRDPSFLSRILSPAFEGKFSSNRGVSLPADVKKSEPRSISETSAAGFFDLSSVDVLIFCGSQNEIQRLKSFLPSVDVRPRSVLIRAAVYEFSSTQKNGSAFSAIGSILNGKLGISFAASKNFNDAIKISSFGLDSVFSAIAEDSRFSVLSSPVLRVRSGANASFSVGQDVPVLGAVSYPTGSSTPVQSIDYRQSGVIFNITADIRGQSIDLLIDQQLSNFIQTDTGVNNSPTLTKRAIKSSVTISDSEVVVIGGLSDFKKSHTNSGFSFLPNFLKSRSDSNDKSEVFLILTAEIEK